jgi:hypothetical protein
MPVGRHSLQIALFVDELDKRGLLYSDPSNLFHDPKFNLRDLRAHCPELYLVAGFYANATPFNARNQASIAISVAGSGDARRIATHLVSENQALKSSLHTWLAMPEHVRVGALGKVLRPKSSMDSSDGMAQTLDSQIKSLAASWIDWAGMLG